ncbi:MAG TPA: phage tail sheath subtilisin-like domain-containing protein [Propionibacteriaceae bacterium]|nr:phage tail sheath subtilisin-like domain-containing protein [Propionibacteriaceae bacterium]
MPDCLTPGVFVEEIRFRARSIEDVSTSTFGMAGLASYGPTPYVLTPPNTTRPVVMRPSPTLVTSLAEFERLFGGPGEVGNAGLDDRTNYLAHAARGFFDNGGRRLVVARVFPFELDADAIAPGNFASLTVGNPPVGTFRARWPGASGNEFAISVEPVAHLTVTVTVRWGDRVDTYTDLALDRTHPRWLAQVLRAEDPDDASSLVWFDSGDATPADLLAAFLALNGETFLGGAGEGRPLTAADIAGRVADPDDGTHTPTGLAALAGVDDIAIVATPDAVRLDASDQVTASTHLIAHCERPGAYRFGIVDLPKNSSIAEVRAFRAHFDTSHAALYYPWVDVAAPTATDPGAVLQLPPSGFVAGVYARTDIERGVHRAPANEVIRGITGLHERVADQSALNPEGINVLRFFEGRGDLVWGARTMSSDAEWRYVNVRRLIIHVEHSIDRSTQWAVFEPNDEALWTAVQRTVEDFLMTIWRNGALLGSKPEEAFFVRCDRTTMTQDDLDSGRVICLVGVAPARPSEFVIFRISQLTADVTT